MKNKYLIQVFTDKCASGKERWCYQVAKNQLLQTSGHADDFNTAMQHAQEVAERLIKQNG